ncbi:MAG: hypothetical protein PHE88_11865, partial [Elusimicrobia bacterium]|nr:hypothetical protein [Elusimicrobiota bacterium]
VKFSHKGTADLAAQIQKKYNVVKEKEDILNKEIAPLKKQRVSFEKALKQLNGELKLASVK